MSYQQIHINNIDFVKQNYTNQIQALNLFYKDSQAVHIPNDKIKFGGGTALAIYYFQHRLSFDIDLFVEDIQYLDFIRPKLWIEESSSFNSLEYIDQYNHIGLITSNNIKVDILPDPNSTECFIDSSCTLFPFEIYVESIENILAKKITFRKKENKTRDIIDIAVAISKDSVIIQKMIDSDKITIEDIQDLRDSLKNLNKDKYKMQIEIVKPFDEFQEITLNAQKIILDAIDIVI